MFMLGRRLAILGLVLAAIGLPVNHLFGYGLLVVAAAVVFTGSVLASRRRWFAAMALAAAAVSIHALLPAPRIDEGHNVFFPGPDAAKTSGLPGEVLAFLDRRFAEQYPPELRCQDESRGCWRPDRRASEDGFAFSADGIFDHPARSRRVTGIGFSDPVQLRLGVVNELIYNWPDNVSDVKRFERDRRSWKIVGRFQTHFPLFVMYRFPADFAGSTLCWRGDVLWERPGERFDILTHRDMACRTLDISDAGRRVFAVSIKRDLPLAMTLEPTLTIRLRQAIEHGSTIIGVAGLLLLLVRVQPRRLRLAGVLIGCALAIVTLVDLEFLGGLRPLDGGDDGFTYDGYARMIMRDLLAGDIPAALMGAEKVYYFTPGFRYFRAFEHFVFGDTYLGYLSLVLALPFLVLALFRRFLPDNWALVAVLLFVATPLGVLFGSSFLLYVKAAARGFADSFGHVALIAGFILIIPRPDKIESPPVGTAFAGALLLAAATFARPNLLLASAAMLAGAAIFALRGRHIRRVIALCLGFSALSVSPIHNRVFGNSYVPFSDNVSQPQTLVMPPSDYIRAVNEVLHLDLLGPHVKRAIVQIGHWLSGPSDVILLAPLHAAAIAALVRVGLFGRRFDPWLRLVALATLLQHGVAACYANFDRYHLSTWLLTSLVCIVWIRIEGLPLFERTFPGVLDRMAGHPRGRRAADLLARVQLACGGGDARERARS